MGVINTPTNKVYEHLLCAVCGCKLNNRMIYLFILTKLFNPIRTHDPDQNRPRATQQGRVKCRRYITVPALTTQEAIPEEGGYLN